MDSKAEDQKEVSYRRVVLTAIETLIDIETSTDLEVHLKHLHGLGWDEVIEERYVNKQCGFPTCSRSPPKKKTTQMYHIDKKEGKIYESCKQRSKFCSEHCYHKSFYVRNQLEEQPLWITGESDERMKKKYDLPDCTFVNPLPEEKDSLDVVMDKEPTIEFVADSIIAQVSNMKLNEEYEEPKTVEDESDQQPYKLSEDDKDFIRSIRDFRTSNFAPSTSQKSPLKPKQVKLVDTDLKKEEEILEKLRAKYGNKNAKQRKLPILIDAPVLNQKVVVMENKTKNAWLFDLIKSWFTPETHRMIRDGARPSGGAAEQILMDFLSGKKVNAEKTVDLPNLDKYNIREKRLNILLHTVRHPWLDLEARLQVTSTRRDLLSRVAATFNLNSENITGWSKKEINSIVLALFIAICLVDVELGDDFFNKENASPELSSVAVDSCGMDTSEVTGLLEYIKNQSAC